VDSSPAAGGDLPAIGALMASGFILPVCSIFVAGVTA
jgi:hypothetical protein